VNIDEIKKSRDEFIKVNEHILELANKQFGGLTLQARIKHETFMQGFDSLLSIIEQAEKALQLVVEDMEADTHAKYDGEEFVLVYKSSVEYIAAKEALQAIRGN
jgi:hypothetical protein